MKPKKCKACGAKFLPRYNTTQQVCSTDCAIKLARKKEAKKARKKHLEQKRKFNQNDPKWVKSKLQQTVNAIVREIDRDLPCLATGKLTGQMQAGHVFSRGAHPQMRFNLHNIHRQTAYSNNQQSHDGLMQENLSLEYGAEYLEYLKDLRGSVPPKLATYEYYQAYLRARKVLKEMDSIVVQGVKMRLRLRNEANKYLAIYPPDILWFR